MNNKIPLRLLAESMAEKAGVTPLEAQNFIKAYFQKVVDELHAGNKIVIDDLGAFSIADNATDPIKFEACDGLSDELNAPFAIFSPIAIDDSSSLDSIMSVHADNEENDSEMTSLSVPHGSSTEFSEISDEEEDVLSEKELIEDSETIPVSANIEAEIALLNVDPEPIEVSGIEDTKIEDVDTPPTLPIEVEEPIEQPVPEAALNSDFDAEDVEEVANDIVVSDNGAIESGADNSETANIATPVSAVETSRTIIPESEEQTNEYYVRRSSRFGIGFVLGLIVGLLIGAICLACYAIYFVNTGISLF